MLSANEFITDSNSAEKLKNLTSELTELKIQSWQELSKFLQDLHRLNKKYRYNKGSKRI